MEGVTIFGQIPKFSFFTAGPSPKRTELDPFRYTEIMEAHSRLVPASILLVSMDSICGLLEILDLSEYAGWSRSPIGRPYQEACD